MSDSVDGASSRIHPIRRMSTWATLLLRTFDVGKPAIQLFVSHAPSQSCLACQMDAPFFLFGRDPAHGGILVEDM